MAASSDSAPHATARAPGVTVPGTAYRLVRALESEADAHTGQVWIVQHADLGTELVAKILPAGHAMAQHLAPQMLSVEARAQTGLTHPGLVRVVDLTVSAAGEPIFVFE